MAHRLLEAPIKEEVPKKKFRFPSVSGKFGISLLVGKKELFFGLAVTDVVLEQIIRRRLVSPTKAKVQVYRFDSLGG